MTAITCRECGRSAAETGTPVVVGGVAFTCSACLMNGADFPCRRCLGAHWDARCAYSAAEAQAAFSARVAAREGQHSAPTSAGREIGSVAKSRFVSAVAISSPSGGSANKTSCHGRPSVDPTLKRAGAATRQRGYRERRIGTPAAESGRWGNPSK